MTPLLRILPLLCLAACSASPKIHVGHEPDGSVAGSSGASGSSGLGGFGGGDNTLTALITEPPSEMAIEVVTISCAGECKQVLAIASGGNPGYTFAWNDGVTTAAREICADDDTTFIVTVTDTAFVDDEFNYEAQTVTASVEARVLACPTDGGVDSGSGSDAAVPACAPLTWGSRTTCDMSTDATLVLSTPLQAGSSLGVRVDTVGLFPGGWDVELWGSDDGCTPTEQLAVGRHTVGTPSYFCLHTTQTSPWLLWRASSASSPALTLTVSACDRCAEGS